MSVEHSSGLTKNHAAFNKNYESYQTAGYN